MSTVELYAITIPVFTRQLKNLSGILTKAQEWCAANNKPDSHILEGRLAPDMQPLHFQIAVATNMVRSGIVGRNWKWVASATDPMPERDFASMQTRIQGTLDLLATVTPEDLEGGATTPLSIWPSGREGAGPEFKFSSGLNFLMQFALPNFWFHNTAAYGICRMQGVPLGKADFLAAGGEGFS